MNQRGRKSSALALVVPRQAEVIERPRPPHDLSAEEVGVWDSIVSQEAADWFNAATLPLLAQYCRHCVHAKRIAEMIERTLYAARSEVLVTEYDKLLQLQERESKVMMVLARSMRLTQQANRNDNSRKKPQVIRSPWTRSTADAG